MDETKQWYLSKTVWGALIAIFASLVPAASATFERFSSVSTRKMLFALKNASAISSEPAIAPVCDAARS